MMLRGYRLIYVRSPQAPPTLWEWEERWVQVLWEKGAFFLKRHRQL